jgi:hypothetical protein
VRDDQHDIDRDRRDLQADRRDFRADVRDRREDPAASLVLPRLRRP